MLDKCRLEHSPLNGRAGARHIHLEYPAAQEQEVGNSALAVHLQTERFKLLMGMYIFLKVR